MCGLSVINDSISTYHNADKKNDTSFRSFNFRSKVLRRDKKERKEKNKKEKNKKKEKLITGKEGYFIGR